MEGEVPGVVSLEPLANGGNSTVYRAWQPDHDRWVAVKVLHVTLSDGPARDRFRRECRAIGRLTGHPNIVMVMASGVTRTNRPFLTMDLFEGSLADGLEPITVEMALHYGVKLAGALETAHRAGILHRDLKPGNVLLSRFGEPGLADFGIATLGEVRGQTEAFTAAHAAPEVLDGPGASAATDIYGLGSTLWSALAGRPPFGDEGQGTLKLMRRVLQEPLPPLGRPEVPAALEEALRWAMAKDPAERPASAATFGQRLQALQAELGLPVSELVVPGEAGAMGVLPPSEQAPAAPHDDPGAQPRPGSPPPAEAQHLGPPAAPTWRRPEEPRQGPPPATSPAPAEAPIAGAAALGQPAPGVTVIRPRTPPAMPAVDDLEVPKGFPTAAAAILVGALALSVALIVVAVVATRDGGTARPATGGTTTAAAPSSSGSAPGTGTARTVTDVAVRTADRTTVVVSWNPPSDRTGLIGFVVLHSPKLGTVKPSSQAVSDPRAVEMTVVLPAPGPRCFVVQAVYPGGGTASDPACI